MRRPRPNRRKINAKTVVTSVILSILSLSPVYLQTTYRFTLHMQWATWHVLQITVPLNYRSAYPIRNALKALVGLWDVLQEMQWIQTRWAKTAVKFGVWTCIYGLVSNLNLFTDCSLTEIDGTMLWKRILVESLLILDMNGKRNIHTPTYFENFMVSTGILAYLVLYWTIDDWKMMGLPKMKRQMDYKCRPEPDIWYFWMSGSWIWCSKRIWYIRHG